MKNVTNHHKTKITIKELKESLANHEFMGTFKYPDSRLFNGIVKASDTYFSIDGLDIPYENLMTIRNNSLDFKYTPNLEIETYLGIGELVLIK